MTVQSYNGAPEVDLKACRPALPDVTDLADHGVHQFELLRGLIDGQEPKAPVEGRAKRSALPAWGRRAAS